MWASLIGRFLDSERDRGLADRSLHDLAMQLRFFERHMQETGGVSANAINFLPSGEIVQHLG